MEALSLDFVVDHAVYFRLGLLTLLLVLSRGRFVRIVIALLAGLELTYVLATNADQATIIWSGIVLGLAILILLAGIIAFGGARLSSDEQAMSTRLLGNTGRGRARHFMDQGYWLNGNSGEVLLREGEPVQQFCYLASGEARVVMAGRPIGYCRSGDVIGGMGFFTGEPAAATVVLAGKARFWVAPAERLKPYLDTNSELKRTIERSIGEAPPAEAEDEPYYPDENKSAISAA